VLRPFFLADAPYRRALRVNSRQAGSIGVQAPLPYVAVHIGQSEGINPQRSGRRWLFAWRSCWLVPVGQRPIVVFKRREQNRAIGKQSGSTGPAGIFPFGFGGQPVGAAGSFGQPPAELDGFIPGDAVHGEVVAGVLRWGRRQVTFNFGPGCDFPPLRLGDFGSPHVEPENPRAHRWTLIVIAFAFIRDRVAHGEAAARHGHQLQRHLVA
jgi:hypothetical protein